MSNIKIKIRDKIIFFDLIEQIHKEDYKLAILYNNGRELIFTSEDVVKFTSTMTDIHKFLSTQQSMGIDKDDLKQKYSIKRNHVGGDVDLIDNVATKDKFNSLVKHFMYRWENYLKGIEE